MVMVLLAQAADTPVGNPVAVPIPVAPVVECVILVKAEFMQRVGVEDGFPTVLLDEIILSITDKYEPELSCNSTMT